MPIPNVLVLFPKPYIALNRPFLAKIDVLKIAQDRSSDYKAELSCILLKTGRDFSKDEAIDYVLGFTCSNDISACIQ